MKITVKRLFITAVLGIALMRVGGSANQLAVEHNDGMMPVWVVNEKVAVSFLDDPDHQPLVKTSQYKAFCDIFVIPHITDDGLSVYEIASIGDLFIWFGRSAIILSQILLCFWIPWTLFKNILRVVLDKIGI